MADLPKRNYRVDELADALGVSTRSVHRWIEAGAVQIVHAGWQIRIPAAEFQKIITEGVSCARRGGNNPIDTGA
jgi:excisionase family DNA binding protein